MKKILSTLTLSMAVSFSAQADLRINGFANLVGGITSSEDTVYGYDDSVSFNDESLFAIQVSGDINDKMTATGQLVARGEDDYNAEFEWAYLTYQATDNLAVSAGRMRMPLFRYSASSDIGYSYHWITAPRAVYDVGFSNVDGLKLDYSNYAGDWEYNLQAVTGTYDADVSGGRLSGKNLMVVSAEATYDWFKVRGVYGVVKATYAREDLDGTINILDNLGLPALAEDMRFKEDSGTFIGFGAEIDTYDYFTSAEITIADNPKTFYSETTSYYVTAGMRTGKFTPSITYEKFEQDDQVKFLDQLVGLPDAILPTATAIVFGLQQASSHDVITLGLRYDMDTNVALKVDLSKYSDEEVAEDDGNMLRFAVNYVF